MSWTLVTGAGRRLGRAVALALAARGEPVLVHFNGSAEDATETVAMAAAAGGKAVAIQADLAEPAAAAALMARATSLVDAAVTRLVNAAATFDHELAQTLSPETFDRQMRVNALAPALLARELASRLPDAADGAVVNFLDFKLAQPYPDHFSYTMSKYALAGATDLLARALAPRVRVNAVAPGYVLPAPSQPAADFERLHGQTPLGRGASADDVAAAALYLLEARSVTGQTLYVDAGLRFVSRARDLSFS